MFGAFRRIKELGTKANDQFLKSEAVYKLVIPRSTLVEAQLLYNSGKLSSISRNGQEYYIEVAEGLQDDEFSVCVRVWPSKWGYAGRQDGHVIYGNSYEAIIPYLIEIGACLIQDESIYEIDEDN